MQWLVIILVAVFVGLSLVFWLSDLWKSDRLKEYVSFLGAFATITIILSFVLTLQNNAREDEQRRSAEQDRQNAAFTSETQHYWVELEQQFADGYPYLASLYKELYPQAQITVPQLTPDQAAEAADRSWHMCAQLLQTIENVVNTSKVTPSDSYGWATVFISWLNSSTLRAVWDKTRQYYNPTTGLFIDGIINQKLKSVKELQSFLASKRV